MTTVSPKQQNNANIDTTKSSDRNNVCGCGVDHAVYLCYCGCGLYFDRFTHKLVINVIKPDGQTYFIIPLYCIDSEDESDWIPNLFPYHANLGQFIAFVKENIDKHPIYTHIKNYLGNFYNDEYPKREIFSYLLSYSMN